jgi:hypothetical protein
MTTAGQSEYAADSAALVVHCSSAGAWRIAIALKLQQLQGARSLAGV